MATGARGGHGSKLEINTTGSTWLAVAESKDIDVPGIENDIQEATNQDSAGWVERIAVGVKDGGEVSFETNQLDSDGSQNALITYAGSGTKKSYRVVYPSRTKKVSFDAIVKSIKPSAPVRGIATLSVTLSVTGPVVIEAHAD
ncbi:MAG: phage tail tube protein [Phycisphaerales bacterium]|nr:phage tail tube protein [Phycisphaerales bacterium]